MRSARPGLRTVPLPLSLVVALAAMGSCGPSAADKVPPEAAGRYAKALCETYARCECLGPEIVDEDACHDAAIQTFRLVEDWPRVRFDKQCFDDVLEYFARSGCEAITDPNFESVPCLVFEGTIAHGEACLPFPALPTIARGGGGGLAEDVCGDGGTCVGWSVPESADT